MKNLVLILGAALAALFIGGCAHDNTLAKAQADATVAQANVRVAEAQASAEESKAVQLLASKIDAGGASAYLIAKAIGRAPAPQSVVQVQQPQSLLGLAWQSALQIADIALRGYGLKATRDVSMVQSNNSRDVALSTNSAFVGMGQSIASAGTAGYQYVQAPQPNITQTLSGTGVLGSGAYTGPVTTTTTRNCNGGSAAAGGAGGGGAAGTATTPGSAGGNAGSGGSAPGGNC